jgi:hypothetical protein
LKFTIKSYKSKGYLDGYKPFQVMTTAISAGGFTNGFSEKFVTLVDTGAKSTCISRNIMTGILANVRDKNGDVCNQLHPVFRRECSVGRRCQFCTCSPA